MSLDPTAFAAIALEGPNTRPGRPKQSTTTMQYKSLALRHTGEKHNSRHGRHLTERDDDVGIDQPDLFQQERQIEAHLLGRRGSVVDRSPPHDVAAGHRGAAISVAATRTKRGKNKMRQEQNAARTKCGKLALGVLCLGGSFRAVNQA